MGYDITRFQGEVDEDLLCPICSGVLEEPVQVNIYFHSREHLEKVKDAQLEPVLFQYQISWVML